MGGSVWQIFYRPEEGGIDHVIFDWRQFSHFYGAPRANPRSPKTIPIYAKASVGHPLISEIRRSIFTYANAINNIFMAIIFVILAEHFA
jgi:hypothetical protein